MPEREASGSGTGATAGGGGGGLFGQNIGYYLDDQRLSPQDDPFLQAWVDEFTRESDEAQDRRQYGLHDQMASSGLLGQGFYAGQVVGSEEEYNEALQGSLKDIYMGAFNQAKQDELAALGMLNQRDMNAASNKAQIKTARIGIRPAMAANALASAQWHANQPWTDLQNTAQLMGAFNGLAGFDTSKQYVPNAAPYTGMSPWAAGATNGIGAAASLYGAGAFSGFGGGGAAAAPAATTGSAASQAWTGRNNPGSAGNPLYQSFP